MVGEREELLLPLREVSDGRRPTESVSLLVERVDRLRLTR